MATVPGLIHAALTALGIPVLSVSVGTETDRNTWIVQFDPSATPAQRSQAASLLATVAVDAAALHGQEQKDVKAYLDAMSLMERAVNLTILDEINLIRSKLPTPLGARTVPQWITAIKAKVDAL